MSGWKMWFHDAPVGAISVGAICLTAVCFPAAQLLTGRERYVAAALLVICGFTFTPAVTCSVYSIVKEKLKMLGGVGLFVAALTVWLQRETLYFIEMGIVLGDPGTDGTFPDFGKCQSRNPPTSQTPLPAAVITRD